jgi:hypothetical protein
MDNRIVNLISFLAGAAVGSLTVWQILKKRDRPIDTAEEEAHDTNVIDEGVESIYPKIHTEKPSINEFMSKIRSEGRVDYTAYSERKVEPTEEEKKEEEVEPVKKKHPYVITPDEFGDEYDKFSLTLYADKVLVDDDDEPIEDVEDTVGWDAFNHFGEYEDDSVFVRNDERQADYEILLDERNYSDVLKTKPHER